MASHSRTGGRGSGTGQDTPKVCVHVPPQLPATPVGTWRDIVPSGPAVPHWVAWTAHPKLIS
jgi:hypothetical protein